MCVQRELKNLHLLNFTFQKSKSRNSTLKKVLFLFWDKAMLKKYCEYCHKVVPYDHDCLQKPSYSYEKKTNPFYLSKQWVAKREYIKHKCFGLDVYDFIVNHTITYGRIVHHIIPLEKNERLKLSDSNLIFLSDSSHYLIHQMLDKNYIETVRKVQKILQDFEKFFDIGGI